jgi:transglutaminase-like putative cysteine protease
VKRRACLAGLAGLTLLAAQAGAAPAAAGAPTRRLRFVMTLSNPHQHGLQAQRLWCYLPAHLPPVQVLQQVQVSMPHRIESDDFGHRILALQWADVPALAHYVVSVSVELSLGAQVDAGSSDPQRWLASERFIESNDPRMLAAARLLQRATPIETARAIYDWVQQHMHYAGYVANDLGALYALNRASGDCTEYAYLVVALARALGIPARMVGGYVQSDDAVLRAQDYHNWAELYLAGRWNLLDAQKGNWLQGADQYVAFRLYRAEAVNAVGLAHRYRHEGELQVLL